MARFKHYTYHIISNIIASLLLCLGVCVLLKFIIQAIPYHLSYTTIILLVMTLSFGGGLLMPGLSKKIKPFIYPIQPHHTNPDSLSDTVHVSENNTTHRQRSDKIDSLAHAIQEYNHELRTPIQIILTQTEKLPNHPDIIERKRKILTAVDKANDIIGTTLRLSGQKDKQDTDHIIHINALISHIISTFCLPSEHYYFITHLSPSDLCIKGNQGDITIIINNILKNACDAMPDGGTITINTTLNQPHVIIRITDTGIGIPAHMINDIWNPFQSRHVTKGRGLGLSIVHRLIQEHQGRVDVTSEVGKGTTFTLNFKPYTRGLSQNT